MSNRRALFFTSSVVFLVFFRSEFAFAFFGSLDPYCYGEHLYHMLGLAVEACPSRSFLPGTAVIWFPLAALAKAAAESLGLNVDHAIRMSIGFTAFGLWTGSLFLVYSTLEHLRPSGSLRTILWTLSVPVLYYATLRTTLSHAPEFFLACAAAWLISREETFPALLVSALACLVRFNALPWLFIVGAAAWSTRERRRSFWSAWILSVAVFLIHTYRVAFVTGYNAITVPFLAKSLGWERLGRVFFGSDWGLVWTSPWWTLTLLGGLLAFGSLSTVGRACLASLVVNLVLCVSWRGNGGDFGYRYLIGTFPAALFLWPEIEARWPRLKQAMNAALWWSAPWMCYLTWIYRTQPDLTPHSVSPDWVAVLANFQGKALRELLDQTVLTAPFWRSPVASLWCSWGGCVGHEPNVFGAQRWGLAFATLVAMITALWSLSRPSKLRR